MPSSASTRKRKAQQQQQQDPVLPAPLNPESAEDAVRNLITQFGLDPAKFQNNNSPEDSLQVSFSKATYQDIAPLVGLRASSQLKDAETFGIHRSRIPTSLFKSIVEGMDVMLVQYGPPAEHKTEEARSRFFAPVFDHLVKQFNFMFRNEPECVIDEGRISTGGGVAYFFKTFGATAVLCIEMKFRIGNDDERLKAVAQIISECDGCDLHNANEGFSLPIHCILSDGLSFEFFKFERTPQLQPQARFFRGCYPGDPIHLRRGHVCETVFDTMPSAYLNGLNAYQTASAARGKKEGSKRPSLDKWDQALNSAGTAWRLFREADVHSGRGNCSIADAKVQEALDTLRESTGAVHSVYENKYLMTDWDEDKISQG